MEVSIFFSVHICGYMHPLLMIYYVCATYNAYRAAFDKVSSEMSWRADTPTSEPKNHSDATVASHGNASTSPSDSGTTPDALTLSLLTSAKPLPPLNPNDFKNLKHWSPKFYRKLRKEGSKTKDITENVFLGLRPNSSGSDVKSPSILSCFIEDKDGNPIPEDERKELFGTARSYWRYLWDNGRAPKSFHETSIETRIQWRTLMESGFDCLRYCSNHWKVDQVWKNYYPTWRKGVLKDQREEKTSKQMADGATRDTAIDVDNDKDSDSNDENNKDNGDNDEDIEEISRTNPKKRGLQDSGKVSKPKRARVEEPKKATPPRPIPTASTTKRTRVCMLYFLAVHITNNV